MVRLLIVGIVAAVAFVVYALIHCLTSPRGEVRALNKPLWALIILVLPVVGGVLWFVMGRGRRSGQGATRRTLAPDDDPEFLGSSRQGPSDLDRETTDERIRRLERELADLDDDDKTGTGNGPGSTS